jgi:hypothetical protein
VAEPTRTDASATTVTAPDRADVWRFPPLIALAFFVLAGLVYVLLGAGNEGNSAVARSPQWTVWKAIASAAVALAVVTAGLGIAAITELISREGGTDTRADRIAAPLRGDPPVGRRTVAGFAVLAFVLTLAALAFVGVVPQSWTWPASLDVRARTGSVAVAIALCAQPWLVLVWLLQRHFVAYAKAGQAISTAHLRDLWDLLNGVVLAFAVFVVLAIVPTGALRVAYFAGPKEAGRPKPATDFRSSDVLLYGAFFAVLLSAIAVPVAAEYRHAARRRVRTNFPMDGEPTGTDDKDAIEWLESLLHLDVGVLKSPITALTVFTPLITAALAGFVPQLGS